MLSLRAQTVPKHEFQRFNPLGRRGIRVRGDILQYVSPLLEAASEPSAQLGRWTSRSSRRRSLEEIAAAVRKRGVNAEKQGLHHLVQKGKRCRRSLRGALSATLRVPVRWLEGNPAWMDISIRPAHRAVLAAVWFRDRCRRALEREPMV